MFEIIIISIFCFVILSILYFTLRTGISPMPSSIKARNVILQASEQIIEAGQSVDHIIELGSGWGTLLFALARKYPNRQIIAYELSWLPWLFTVLYTTVMRLKNIVILRQNFLTAELPEASLLICYLHPKAMSALAYKLDIQSQQHYNLISSTFALPNVKALQTIRLDDLHQTPIYIYKI